MIQAALCQASIDFDAEVCDGAPNWRGPADLFARMFTLRTVARIAMAAAAALSLSLQATCVSHLQ